MKKLIRAFIFFSLALVPNAASAALQARITNVSDFNLGTWKLGDPAIGVSINICVYAVGVLSNDYSVTATAVGGYNLFNGLLSIPYTLFWDDGGDGNLGAASTQMTNGVALANRKNGNISSSTCASSGQTARLTLKITQTVMAASIAGTYSGTITLMVTPS